MERLTALAGMNEDNSSTQFSISSGDIQRLNQRRYDELNEMTKEELIYMIMGDEPYYNR